MDCACHVTKKLSGLSVPDCNMDCVCHVTMKLSGLSVPDCNMDCVCHVTLKLPGLSVPDCNMDCVCHVATDVSGLSIPDVHMETCHGYHLHELNWKLKVFLLVRNHVVSTIFSWLTCLVLCCYWEEMCK